MDALRFGAEPDSGIEIVGTGFDGDADRVLRRRSRTAGNMTEKDQERTAKTPRAKEIPNATVRSESHARID